MNLQDYVIASPVRDHTEEILDCVHNGILAIDTNGVITVCNKAAGHLLSINPEDVIGKKLLEVIDVGQCTLSRVIATGQPEYSLKIKVNGRTMVSNHTPLLTENKLVGAVAVFQDITELERVSSELESVRQLCNRLDTVFGSSFDGIMVTDATSKVVRINKALARLTGLDDSYFVGKPIDDLVRNGIFKFESVTAKALREGRTVTAFQYINPSKKEVLVTASPVCNDDGSVAWIITNLRDITELNQLKEKLRESQMKTALYHAELSLLLKEKIRHETVIAESKEMLKVLNTAIRVAQTDSTILITGESGAGKEVVAQIIHNVSGRSKGNFIQVNCGAIPENLLEAELFGYEAGAFTDARKQGKTGLLELANKGSIMLDEIAEMPINLQVKLLRVLQEQEFYRLGGTKTIKLNVRVIAATNKDLWECVCRGTFREDLFYRINVVPINVPPLRQRREDIIPLVMHFLNSIKEKYQVEKRLEPGALDMLEEYRWPGNVRELKNVIERLIILSEGNTISVQQVAEQLNRSPKRPLKPVVVNGLLPLKDAQEMLEKDLLEMAMNRHKTTRKAARALGIAQSSVVRKLARYNIKSVQQWTTSLDI